MAWTLIPCLVALRAEFNAVAPGRDRGADGSIGDSSHTSSSDHTPDEDSDVLRDHDADDRNEVHALDIDSDGPWPDGTGREAGGWLDRTVRAIAARERQEYLSPDIYGRLQYIIWRGQIISRSWAWSEWRTYTGASKHYDHVHFSARYLTNTEADTRPWGVEDDMPLTAEDKSWILANVGPAATWAHKLQDPYAPEDPKRNLQAGAWLRHNTSRGQVAAVAAQVAQLAGKDLVDEPAIVAGVLAGLTPERIAAAIPAELAEQVAAELAARLAS